MRPGPIREDRRLPFFDRVVQHFFYSMDLRITRIIGDVPRLTENQIGYIKSCLAKYSASVSVEFVRPYSFDCMLSGLPINLIEIQVIYMAVQAASGGGTWFWQRRDPAEISPEEKSSYACLVKLLESALEEMVIEKRTLVSHNRLVDEQDLAASQRRMLRLATLAALASALAAIGSFLVAYMQFRGRN